MTYQRIATLLVILIILGVLIYLVDRRQDLSGSQQLLDLRPDRVYRLEIQRGKNRFDFIKRDQYWYLEKPVSALADNGVIKNILDDFCNLHIERLVEKSPENLKKYGLEKPDIQLTIYGGGGVPSPRIIQLGMLNSLDSTTYARLLGDDQVVLITSYRRDSLEKDLFYFREKKFFYFEPAEAVRLTFRYQNREFEFHRKNRIWYLEKPLFSVVPETVLSNMLVSLSHLEARSFADLDQNGPGNNRDGNQPLVEVKLGLKSGERMLTIFRRGQRVFGYPRGSGEVCEIDPGFIMQFAKDTADYREHRVAPFYSFDVKEFTFTGSGGRKANLKRGDDSRWHGTDQGIERPVDGEKVNEFLTILQDLEADSFMDHPEGGESFSINLEIQISGHGPQPEVIHLSFSRFHGEGILVKNRDLPYLFKLSGDFARKLSQRVEDFFR